MTYNRIPVAFGATKKVTGPEISYQYDVVQKLMIKGLDLPAVYRVDFCNEGDAQTISMTGDADGVAIPDQLLQTGKKIKAYIMLMGTDEGAVETRYEAILPVNSRPAPSDIQPTPAEQQQIDALIEALNDGVERAEDAAEQAEEAAELLTNPSAEATTLEPGSPATAEYDEGVFKFGIPKGPKGDKLTYADLTDADKADLVQGPIAEAQTAAVQAVNTAGDTQTERVNTAGTTQTDAVNQAGTAQVAAVEAEGTEQVGAVRAKGAEVLESIPDDYTKLQHHVDAVTIYETASGAIASFEDGADDLPIKKLVANIEPVQDLHGYANPWPAGGGVNKLSLSGSYTASEASSVIPITDIERIPAGEYTLSIRSTNAIAWVAILYAANSTELIRVASNESIVGVQFKTFTIDSDIYKIRVYVNGATTLSDLQIELGTTATAYTPYSNLCPISGHTGLNVKQRGRNILPPMQDGTYSQNGVTITVKDGIATFSGTSTNTANISIPLTETFVFPDKDVDLYIHCMNSVKLDSVQPAIELSSNPSGNPITYSLNPVNRIGLLPAKFKGRSYDRIRFWITTGITISGTYSPMICADNTPTVYEPYTGNQISVNWEDEAGTVYGGTLDLVSGKLTVDRAMVDLGALNYTYGDNYKIFITSLSGVKIIDAAQVPNMISSMYKGVSWSVGATDGTKDGIMCILPAYNQLRLRNLGYTDPTAFKTAMSGQAIVYELATPITYQLTPQEIRTLLGTNNVWVGTGDIAECEYPADTKLYIQQLTKPTEDDMVANANIAANKFFMIGNALYYSTAAIAAGATIIPGTNCNAVSLADALNTLNA